MKQSSVMSKTRILVVDDDPEIRRVFTRILNDAGYDVLQASKGREGLQLAREMRPDLALLDVLLPDLNGMEVCKQIKTDPDLRDVFVVLISGGAMNVTHKVEGLESGADDYMVKPFYPDELLARIRTIMRLKDLMAALRASEEHHRRLVNILPDAVCLIHPEGRLLAVNSQAVTMLGYASPEELIGKSAFDIAPAEEHERIKADIAATLQTGIIRNTGYTLLKKNGVPLQVELSATVSLDGNNQPAGLVIVGHDVTKRKQAEQKIRQLLDLLDHAYDAIIIRDLEARVQYFNKGAERLLGWTADEVRGRCTADLFFEDTSIFAEAQKILLQTGEWSGELQVVTKARKPLMLHSQWTLVHGPKSQSPHVVSISTDITERKRAEEELRQLPWRIIEAQETERLRVAREIHDGVNQVIASVKLRLRKVESHVGTRNPAAREILARCDKLLVQALEENRRIAHNLRPSDLDELGLADACRNFCKEIQARTNLSVKCNIAPLGQRLPSAVELNLFRIVQEALTNIEKHARAKMARLRLSFRGDSVVLRIQDDGRGFVAHRLKSRKGKWRGIGLTHMRERALSLGGECEVLSAPKKGTIITVRIPCPQAE